MLTFYRGLLYLYPSLYRREFAEEMVCVFRDAQADVLAGGFRERICFPVRETCGLLGGAVQEHIRAVTGRYPLISFTRFNMRAEFRFPRSTVFLMSIIFAGVIVAMEKANTIQVKYGEGSTSIWPSLPWFLGLMLLFTCVMCAARLGILFALRRTGAHRLADIQTGANSTD
jgi:hypothetical protein